MVNSTHLDLLERLGFGSDVSALESYVELLQEAAASGNALVDDPVYDQHFKLLEVLKPDSEILHRNWEEDGEEELHDFDELLKMHPMLSIRTATVDEDLEKYFDKLKTLGKRHIDLFISYKMNGHASRVVYQFGELVSGTARGRYKPGRSLTRHFKKIIPTHIDFFEPFPLVEIRGELIVSYKNFMGVLSKTLKTPLSSVTSLVRASVSDEELKYLEFIAYSIFVKGEDGEEFELGNMDDVYNYLTACGFKVPKRELVHGVDLSDPDKFFANALKRFSDEDNLMDYDTDGIVVSVNDAELFKRLGTDGNRNVGNLAVKMGRWECNKYTSTIQEIVWERGKKWFTPKASIVPTKTADGKTVSTVPLYNAGVIIKMGLKPGSTIAFRFGGETGVQLLTLDGKSVTCLD